MKNVMISEEENKVLEKLRAEKSGLQAARDIQKEEQKKTQKLTKDFEKALVEANEIIDQHIEDAESALQEAISVSERFGIPFKIDLECMPKSRQYLPHSANEKWEKILEIDECFFQNYDFWCDDLGWERWNSSSLNC